MGWRGSFLSLATFVSFSTSFADDLSSKCTPLLDPRNRYMATFARAVLRHSSSRDATEVEFFKRYKNDAGFRRSLAGDPTQNHGVLDVALALETFAGPRSVRFPENYEHSHTITLSLSDLNIPSPVLKEIFDRIGGVRYDSLYHENLLRLNAGDSVVFEGAKRQSFRVGEFVDSGNTTMIWRLFNDPSKVLRIPRGENNFKGEYKDYSAVELTTLHVARTAADGIAGAVSVRQTDPESRFTVVDYVPGNLAGFEWLKKNELAVFHLIQSKFSEDAIRAVSVQLDTRPTIYGNVETIPKNSELGLLLHQTRKLLATYHRYEHLEDATGPVDLSEWERLGWTARQIVWSEADDDWKLVDW